VFLFRIKFCNAVLKEKYLVQQPGDYRSIASPQTPEYEFSILVRPERYREQNEHGIRIIVGFPPVHPG
jgi:hypothetical protein